MISIQKRLFLTDKSRGAGLTSEPLSPITEEMFVAHAKSEEFINRAEKIIAQSEKWWQEKDPEARKALHDQLQKMKRSQLEVYVFQGTASDHHRLQASIELNGLYSVDFDGIDCPDDIISEWKNLWPVIDPKAHPLSRMAEELNLVYIGKSISQHGLRLVGKCRQELDLWGNQQWLARQLMLPIEPDAQCKDSNRASYAVPYSHISYLSPELFTYSNPDYDAQWGPVYRQKGRRPAEVAPQAQATQSKAQAPQAQSTQSKAPQSKAPENKAPQAQAPQAQADIQQQEAAQHGAPTPAAAQKPADDSRLMYLGIPIREYIDMYWLLFHNGSTPSEGARDSLTFELACHIRHICGFSREVLDAVIPCYDGFPETEKLKVIDSALREERKQMPVRMRQVLDAVSRKHQENVELGRALDTVTEENNVIIYEQLRPALPFGMRDTIENQQPQLAMSLLVPQFPIIGALATHVRLDIHNEGFKRLNLQVYIAGKSASNKQHISQVWHLWTRPLKIHDDEMRQLEAEQEALLKRQKNAKEQPEEKVFPQRLQSSVTSMTQILMRLKNAQGEHLLTYAEESDAMAKRMGPAWSDMTVLLRAAYDNSSYSQDFHSEASVRVWLDEVLWNIVLCGTEDALYRMYRNYTDGSLTRVLIGSTPDNTFSPLIINKKRSDKAVDNINALVELLPLMQGDLVLPKLEKRCQKWLERVRLETMKDDDRVRANQRFRIGVSVMRCLCCMMLCDFGGWLIREIDRKSQKPEWAEGCTTAREYLALHPNATADWVARKFQKKAILDIFEPLADYFMDNVLYFFRDRIEKAYTHQEDSILNTRRGRGRNDSIFERLPEKFTIARAMQERTDDPTGTRTRSMIKNWARQGLVRNVALGEYQKL